MCCEKYFIFKNVSETEKKNKKIYEENATNWKIDNPNFHVFHSRTLIV